MTSWVNKAPITTSSALAPKGATFASSFVFGIGTGQNRLYAPATRKDSEISLNVVMGMLRLISHDVYCLIYLRSTISYMTLFVVVNFGFGLYCISGFFVSTLVGDSMIIKRVYRVWGSCW